MLGRRLCFAVIGLLFAALLFFLVAEISSRIVIGNRLAVHVDSDGLYRFEPNQYGWYSHLLSVPRARINNIGARGNDVNVGLLNKTNKYVFLGDSFTFGWVLSDDETIPYYFMKNGNLSNDQVLNFGNGGYGIDHMIGAYNFHKSLFGAQDIVVMIMPEGDFYRQMQPYEKSLLKEVFWWAKKKSAFIAWVWASIAHMRALSSGKQAIAKSENNHNLFVRYGEKLLAFQRLIRDNNQTLVYVFYEYNSTNYSAEARAFCNKNSLLCITDAPKYIEIVKKNGGKIYALDGGHPSAEANSEIATAILKYVGEIVNDQISWTSTGSFTS